MKRKFTTMKTYLRKLFRLDLLKTTYRVTTTDEDRNRMTILPATNAQESTWTKHLLTFSSTQCTTIDEYFFESQRKKAGTPISPY